MAKRVMTIKGTQGQSPILEFYVRGPAISAQVKGLKGRERLRLWKALVAEVARNASAQQGPLTTTIAAHLIEFSAYPTNDRDNMAKPILDAMQGIAYENDRQVRHLRVEWCDINGAYKVRSMSSVVARAMVEGHEFVWIRLYRHVTRESLV